MEFKELEILNHITNCVEILFYVQNSVAAQKILPRDIRGQIHPGLDQIDVAEQLLRVEALARIQILLVYFVNEALDLQNCWLDLF